jgi:hypothetical protein
MGNTVKNRLRPALIPDAGGNENMVIHRICITRNGRETDFHGGHPYLI